MIDPQNLTPNMPIISLKCGYTRNYFGQILGGIFVGSDSDKLSESILLIFQVRMPVATGNLLSRRF